MFMNSLDRSMNAMTNTFYSSPRSSGGSFSGAVGFLREGGFGRKKKWWQQLVSYSQLE